MKNHSGKTSIIFLILIIVILVSGICISVFLLQQEKQGRITAEQRIEELLATEKKLSTDLESLKKQVYILNEKNKEADEKINNLLDDLELEEGLREQLREENVKLKETLDKKEGEKEELRKAMSEDLTSVQEQLKQAQDNIEKINMAKEELEAQIAAMEDEKQAIQEKLSQAEVEAREAAMAAQSMAEDAEAVMAATKYERSKLREERMPASPVGVPSPVDLDPIVIDSAQGRVLSVDTRTEFLIFDMGLEDGIRPGQVVSIYRGDKFLGDVKVSRVQEKMSAADFIPPFSSTKVRKNDIVVLKPF